MTMADRWRKGISTNESHDQRNTRKPDDENMIYDDSSLEYGNQQDRNKSTPRTEGCRIRDSGYNTDVSPARTSSSTSTPAEHFSFDYPEQTAIATTSIATGRPWSSPPSSRSTLPAIPSSQSHSPEVSTEYYLPKRYESSNLSRSAPGGHIYVTHPPPSILFDSNPDTTDEGTDEIDGWIDPLTSSQNLSVDTALLPKEMSNSFQDLRDGEEGESEEDDVMTSSEERENEERFIHSNVKRMSLRKRNYSGPDEEDMASYQTEGTAYMHLRRGSADITTLLRHQPHTPLPDIIPMSRDRAQSAPNLQDILMRQRAQRAGRELRRLSDLFHENVVRRNSANGEDNDSDQSSSYPRMGPSFLWRESMRALVYARSSISRRGSSVDDESFPVDSDSDS